MCAGRMAGKVALVTGGGRGIGRGIGRRLAIEGAVVVLGDVDGEAACEAATQLEGEGLGVRAAEMDVTDDLSVDAAVHDTVEREGRIDILVNNAGIRCDRTLQKMTNEEWTAVVDTDLRSAFFCSRSVLPHMPEGGRIVSISSRLLLGNFGSTNYAAAKSGLLGLSRSLALEVAKRQITVNVVAPGVIQTPGLDEFKASAPAAFQHFIDSTPMGRPGDVADIAGAVAFLCSDDAKFVTGQTIFVCGGWSIGAAAW